MLIFALCLSLALSEECLVETTVLSSTPSSAGDYDVTNVPSMAIDGDVAVVGFPWLDEAAVLRRQPDGSWLEEARIASPLNPGGRFGFAVDVDGDRLAITSPSAYFLERGTVQIYEYQAGSWVWVEQFGGLTPDSEEEFGIGVALDGHVLAVLAEHHATVSIFRESAGHWSFDQEFELDPGGFAGSRNDSIELVGDDLFIGCANCTDATGAIASYLYADDGTQFALEAVFTTEDDDLSMANSPFVDTAAHGDWVAQGRPWERLHDSFTPQPAPRVGAVRFYRFDGTDWNAWGRILSPEPLVNGRFGYSVEFEGDLLAVSEPGHDEMAPLSRMHLYRMTPSGPESLGSFEAANGTAGLGLALAFDGERLAAYVDRQSTSGEAVQWFHAVGTPQIVGMGVGGASGTPSLRAQGCSTHGSGASLVVHHGPPHGVGGLLYGDTTSAIGAFGGTLYVGPTYGPLLPHTLNANGSVAFTGGADPAVLGTPLTFQVGYLDASAPGGVALSNGLRVRF